MENTESFKHFPVPLEKEIRKVDKDGNDSVATISYKIKFIQHKIYGKLIIKCCC